MSCRWVTCCHRKTASVELQYSCRHRYLDHDNATTRVRKGQCWWNATAHAVNKRINLNAKYLPKHLHLHLLFSMREYFDRYLMFMSDGTLAHGMCVHGAWYVFQGVLCQHSTIRQCIVYAGLLWKIAALAAHIHYKCSLNGPINVSQQVW